MEQLNEQFNHHLIEAEKRFGPIEDFIKTHTTHCKTMRDTTMWILGIMALATGALFTQLMFVTGRQDAVIQRQNAQAERMTAAETRMNHEVDLILDQVKAIRDTHR